MSTKRTIQEIERDMEEDAFVLLGRIEFHATDNHRDGDRERLSAIAELLRGFFARRERLRWELVSLPTIENASQPRINRIT